MQREREREGGGVREREVSNPILVKAHLVLDALLVMTT